MLIRGPHFWQPFPPRPGGEGGASRPQTARACPLSSASQAAGSARGLGTLRRESAAGGRHGALGGVVAAAVLLDGAGCVLLVPAAECGAAESVVLRLGVAPAPLDPHLPGTAAAGTEALPDRPRSWLFGGAPLFLAAGCVPQVTPLVLLLGKGAATFWLPGGSGWSRSG